MTDYEAKRKEMLDSLPIVYTPQEVANHLRVSVRSVYRWVDEGKLPSIKVCSTVRIKHSDLLKILGEPEQK